MVDTKGFKVWLHANTKYSEKVICDIVSRLRRVDNIQPWSNEEIYQFNLEHNKQFAEFSVFVRSQCKRAVKLYAQYVKEESQGGGRI